jgi:signal transduction histidine kinase
MLPEYLKRIEEAVVVIHDQIAFTKEYQNLGIAQPAWQDVSFAFRKAASCFDLSNKTVAIETKGTEIYADPLLDRVFYNLIDNTLKHGMTATHIAVHAGRSDAGFDIIYEDNGTGILENDKKKVFLRGIGRNSGLGLYLAREILSITGIDIRETGEPGTGARFEIRIPKGGYRCVSPSRGNTI